ncbi:jmjC domain-containing protein 8-like [Sycon ciliatum]|uniref:jmjC domain-containing protein 8-like n=1 Tax=Sycon ciliatum TaxID=27933 RepID=UPI0031F70480
MINVTSRQTAASMDKAMEGGWKQGTYLFSADDTCALPRFTWDGITAETFNNLVELSLPFLVVNTEPMHSVLRKLFTRENTDKLFSTVDLLTGHIPYGEVFGLYGGMATGKEMLEYIDGLWKKYAFTARQWEKQGGRAMLGDEPPLYIFDSSILQETFNKSGSGFPYPLPGFLPEWRKQVHQFIWGPPGSGSPVHYHCPALNIMAYGRKRWTLYPPASAHYSTVHPLHVRTRPQTPRYKPEPLACVQYAGEMLFIPKHWAHSTVNIDQAIGIAVEFDLPFC